MRSAGDSEREISAWDMGLTRTTTLILSACRGGGRAGDDRSREDSAAARKWEENGLGAERAAQEAPCASRPAAPHRLRGSLRRGSRENGRCIGGGRGQRDRRRRRSERRPPRRRDRRLGHREGGEVGTSGERQAVVGRRSARAADRYGRSQGRAKRRGRETAPPRPRIHDDHGARASARPCVHCW